MIWGQSEWPPFKYGTFQCNFELCRQSVNICQYCRMTDEPGARSKILHDIYVIEWDNVKFIYFPTYRHKLNILYKFCEQNFERGGVDSFAALSFVFFQ